MRDVYEKPSNPRVGKFQKAQQDLQDRFYKYLQAIGLYADGYMTPVQVVAVTSGTVDTEKIKQILHIMEEGYGKDWSSQNKDFYLSYLYCTITLYALGALEGFTYIESSVEDSNAGIDPDHHFPPKRDKYKPDHGMNFRRMAEQADMVTVGRITGFSDTNDEPDYLEYLYHLLAGKRAPRCKRAPDLDSFLTFEEEFAAADLRRRQEMEESLDSFEKAAEEHPEMQYEDEEEAMKEWSKQLEEQDAIRKNAGKSNQKTAKLLKEKYPGYQDYILHYERFVTLYPTCASPEFFHTIKELITRYLLSEGLCIYQDTEAFKDSLLAVEAALKSVKKQWKTTLK